MPRPIIMLLSLGVICFAIHAGLSAPAQSATDGAGLVVFELYGSDTCPACGAAESIAGAVASDYAGRVVVLETDLRLAPASRSSRWWAACGTGERVWLPLVMTDSGFQCWSPSTTRGTDRRAVFQGMIDATLDRPPGVDLAAWLRLDGAGLATVLITATNVSGVRLNVDQRTTLHLITADRGVSKNRPWRVHDAATLNLGPMEPEGRWQGESLVRFPETVPNGRIEVVALVDYLPLQGTPGYRLLGAAVASSDRPTETPSPTWTVSPTPTPTIATGTPLPRLGSDADPWPQIRAVARTDNPFYTTTRFTSSGSSDDPAVVAFRDTALASEQFPLTMANPLVLATKSQVGTTFGLAYDWRRAHIYTAAYNEPIGSFIDGQAGAIYRIDLTTDTVYRWAVLDAGPDLHGLKDAAGASLAAAGVGRNSLGDIEVDEPGENLFVVNLHERRIYRFSLPDGRMLGSFEHGAANEPWAPNARPFGLGWHNGWIYHGVVDSRQDVSLPGALSAYVYRSRPDGTDMAEVVSLALGYDRIPRWVPWEDGVSGRRWSDEGIAQPMLTDIEFRPNGDPILGLRDRLGDAIGVFNRVAPNGDILPTVASGPARWSAITDPEYYDDSLHPLRGWGSHPGQYVCEECTTGTLAAVPRRDAVVASMRLTSGSMTGALWFDNRTGARRGPADGIVYIAGEDLHGGDVESLAQPGDTIYLPMLQRYECGPRTRPPADITIVIDASTTMLARDEDGGRRLNTAISASQLLVDTLAMSDDSDSAGPRLLSHDQMAVVGFNDEAWLESGLTTYRPTAHAALGRLATKAREGTRLDLALQAARGAATGDWSRELASRRVVLLTDGWSNRVPPGPDGRPESTVLQEGKALRDAGIELVVVGIGRPEDVNHDVLRALADNDVRYFVAHDAAALHRVFATLSRQYRCRPAPGF